MSAYPRDEAWDNDDGKDNPRLKDGDRVVLGLATLDDLGRVVPAGTEGVVAWARTPRVFERKEFRPAHFFANVDTREGVRVRVPHSALRVLK